MNKLFNRIPEYPVITLIEETPFLRDTYLTQLQAIGYNVLSATSIKEGIDLLLATRCFVAVLDLSISGYDGVEAIRALAELAPKTSIITISSRSDECNAQAVLAGAEILLPTMPEPAQFFSAIQKMRNTRHSPPPLEHEPQPNGIISQSRAMKLVYDRIRSAAQTDAPTLIIGESGTGKELCARTIHNLSHQARANFITLDCAASGPGQFEADLLGYVKDGMPGEMTGRDGLATLADRGTLFLREVCELDLTSQSKLLRFIQTMRVLPLGSSTSHPVKVRIIASTSIPPEKAVAEGRLRSELFYELQTLSIRVPNIRERVEDIMPLAKVFLARYSALEGRNFTSFHPLVEQAMRAHSWPGNVHQMMSFIRAITILHDAPQVTMDMLPDGIHPCPTSQHADIHHIISDHFDDMTLAEIERSAIETAINRNNGSIPRAAQELAVAPSTIYRKMEMWKS